MKKVLVSDYVHPTLNEGLKKMGYEVVYEPNITDEEVRQQIDQYEGIIINSKIQMDRPMLEKGKSLKFIGRLGAGREVVDEVEAAKRNIAVHFAPEGNRNAVSEHALGMLLCLFNKLHLANEDLRAGNWEREKHRGVELSGKTVGIVGYGNTGSYFAKKLTGFDVEILAYDKYKENFGSTRVIESTMETIFQAADVISLHVPLTDETNGLVDAKWLNSFKKPIYLINTSRGQIVKYRSLLNSIRTKKVLGACLDVHETEPLGNLLHKDAVLYSDVVNSENTLLSPHVAGWTSESRLKFAQVLLAKIVQG